MSIIGRDPTTGAMTRRYDNGTNTFIGSATEWNNLSAAEKSSYDVWIDPTETAESTDRIKIFNTTHYVSDRTNLGTIFLGSL